MRIDAHHFFTEQHPLEHLKPILERNRFDGSIAMDDGGFDYPQDFVLGVVRRIDLDSPGFEHRLDEWQRDPRFCGVRYRLADRLPDGFVELARRGIPLDLELEVAQLSMLPRIADRAPGLRMVLDDLAGPPFGSDLDERWARGMEEAARLPQVFCKASNLIPRSPAPWNSADMRPWVKYALSLFGPERLMFGSGWPGCLPAAGWKETLAAFTQSIGAQTMETREWLLGGAAARFYGLGFAFAGTDART